jgi:exonuclease III
VLGDARGCASPGLEGAELVPCELAIPPSLRYTQIYRGRREMIDHVLLSRGLYSHFTSARVLNETLREAETGPDSVPFGSDHAPLLVCFRI